MKKQLLLLAVYVLFTSCATYQSLKLAGKFGNLEYIKTLPDDYLNRPVDQQGNTVLITAIIHNQFKTVDYLTSKTAVDINRKNAQGMTPLIAACVNNNLPIVRLLIERKADIDNRMDYTPFNALLSAVTMNYPEIVRILLENKADPNIRYGGGYTPVILAAQLPSPEILEILLEYGSDPLSEDLNQKTALHHAVEKKRFENIKVLLKNPAKINQLDQEGKFPLFTAAGYSPEIAEMLIKNGADVNQQGLFGITPLMVSITFNQIKTAEILLKNRADIRLKDQEGKTAYDYAVIRNNPEMINLLKNHP